MREKVINVLKLCLLMILFFNLSDVIVSLLQMIGIDISLFNYADYGYLDTLLELIYTIVVFVLYRKYFNHDFQELNENRKNNINTIFKLFALFFAVKIASSVLTSIIALILGYEIGESENQNMIIRIMEQTPILMIISSTILAPIVEEGIFRLGLRKIIKNEYLFIIISGFIFGFMHIFPTDLSMSLALTYSITYVIMGFYLAYVYVETDNIWINIIIHGLNNLISMLAIIALY